MGTNVAENDDQVSVSVDLTPTGVNAKANSRFLSALDKLGGNLVDFGNAWLEAPTARKRAKTAGEVKLIEAVAQYGVDRASNDEAFAERALANHFRKIGARQANKDAVLAEALEDLRNDPPSEESANSGPEFLNEQFIVRLESYAETASTDDLRQRWGKVLASEVRAPGSFSPKVLRAVDELDFATAALFERVCASRLAQVIPKPVSGELSFDEAVRLRSAELIVEPGLGQLRRFSESSSGDGTVFWLAAFDNYGLGFEKSDGAPPTFNRKGPLTSSDGAPAIPVYVLTEVGYTISRILPYNELEVLDKLYGQIASALPSGMLKKYVQKGEFWVQF